MIINDVVRNNPNTHWQGSTAQAAAAHSTALDCPVLASALAQHRSQTNPPASLHSTKWRPRARPDQAAAQCPSLPRDTVDQYNVLTFNHTISHHVKHIWILLLLFSAMLEMCEHGEFVYIVSWVSRGKGIEPESCIGRVWSSLRSWLGLVAGLSRAVTLTSRAPCWVTRHWDPGGGRDSVSGRHQNTQPVLGLITSSHPDNSLQLEGD